MISAILVAGGKGERLKRAGPKALLKIAGKELFLFSLEKFHLMEEIAEIILVLPKKYIPRYEKKLKIPFPKLKKITQGGKRRQDSVFSGLKCISPKSNIILIHDTARPLITEKLINSVIKGTKKYGACIPAIPVADTIKQIKGAFVQKTLERKNIFSVQTPQGFRKTLLGKAYKKAITEDFFSSDDAGLVEKSGEKVCVVEGEKENIKVTYPSDIKIAEFYLKKH